jgi:pyrimidine-nucleoside phosphorylase
MRTVDIIRKKRDGFSLEPAEIEAFVAGATNHTWPDYQVAALLMAIVLRGMDAAETAALTAAKVRSGVTLDWADLDGVPVDKHSTGGVGDKISLVLLPLAAACGVLIPKMSGRGLGHTGGTLDKMEAIPGCRVSLDLDELRAAVKTVGAALVSQTAQIAPADKALYALRDVTGTVESIPLISASIMSKKIAEGISALVLDVKSGSGAFMKTRDDARRLARSLIDIGTASGVQTQVLITAMDVPLGRAVGNALEVVESIAVLRGEGPDEVRTLASQLAARMVVLARLAGNLQEAEARVADALRSGRVVEKFRQMIQQQGGDPRVIDDPGILPAAPHREVIQADRTGYVQGWDAERVGRATVLLGAGRDRVGDTIDPAVGAVVLVRPGDRVKPGDGLLELHYRDSTRLKAAKRLLDGACPIADEPPAPAPLILEAIE